MFDFKDVTVIIPSLNPDEKLVAVVDGVFNIGFTDVILVNDGSSEDCIKYFDLAKERHPECVLLTHEVNKGKGRAMKTAFEWYLANRGGAGVITVDGDGQHLPEDIKRVAVHMIQTEELTLGARDFSLSNVPARSRFGNRFTSFMFHTACGLRVSDTQTGLRAIPAKYLDIFLRSEGDRYEYETNMLLDCGRKHIPFGEVPIETVYLDENSSSHFHPIRDSLRIYKHILKYLASSLSSYLIDITLFTVFTALGINTFLSAVIARVVSSLFNFFINKKVVFNSDGKFVKTMIRYYALAIPQMLISAFAVTFIVDLLSIDNVALKSVIKALIDVTIFFASYFIQKKWVFRNDKDKTEKNG